MGNYEYIKGLQEIIAASDNIVFFGGAGVSVESGIPDFRSANGIYNQQYHYPPEMIISHDFFLEHPSEFYEFYREKLLYLDAKPNTAHLMLAELERAGKLKAVITQNIDGLHQAAGSKNVLELHGSVLRNFCMSCHKPYDVTAVAGARGIPHCSCGGIIKPDVVLYGESLNEATMNQAVRYIAKADVLIIGGTSLGVYPAAGMVNYFNGSKLVLINRSATIQDSRADLLIRDNIGEVMARIK